MNLVDYLATLSKSDQAGFNKKIISALGVNKTSISHWVSGRQQISPKNAKQLEILTDGVVKREDLRPDIFE